MYRTMADTVEKSDPETLATLMSQAPIPPIFADVPGFPPTPDIKAELQPTVFRGAGLSDLPPLESLTALTQPTLILAWTGDPGHPVSTAEKLASTLPNAELHVSDSQADLSPGAGGRQPSSDASGSLSIGTQVQGASGGSPSLLRCSSAVRLGHGEIGDRLAVADRLERDLDAAAEQILVRVRPGHIERAELAAAGVDLELAGQR